MRKYIFIFVFLSFGCSIIPCKPRRPIEIVQTVLAAQQIAEAVIVDEFGEPFLQQQKPFKVTFDGDKWVVTTSNPSEISRKRLIVEINKQTGEILRLEQI